MKSQKGAIEDRRTEFSENSTEKEKSTTQNSGEQINQKWIKNMIIKLRTRNFTLTFNQILLGRMCEWRCVRQIVVGGRGKVESEGAITFRAVFVWGGRGGDGGGKLEDVKSRGLRRHPFFLLSGRNYARLLLLDCGINDQANWDVRKIAARRDILKSVVQVGDVQRWNNLGTVAIPKHVLELVMFHIDALGQPPMSLYLCYCCAELGIWLKKPTENLVKSFGDLPRKFNLSLDSLLGTSKRIFEERKGVQKDAQRPHL